jgi:lipopolysaccharide assembly outer membrane protein LptD (OstA)
MHGKAESTMGIRFLLAGCAWIVMAAAWADSFAMLGTSAQFRAATVDDARGVVYVAAYDGGAVWTIDPVTWQRTGRVATGEQPVALALGDGGDTLAVVNRGDATLSLIHVPTNSVFLTSATGNGPVDVAALPGNQFAVANSFEDSLTVIDGATGTATTISGMPGVPLGVASTGNYLAVVGRTASAVRIIKDVTGPGKDIAIPFLPTAIEGLKNGLFAAAGPAGIALIDPASQKIVQTKTMAADALAVDGETLLTLSGMTIQRLDAASLNLLDTQTLSAPAQVLAAGGGIIAAISPAAQAWQVQNSAGMVARAPAIPAPPAPVIEPVASGPLASASETTAQPPTLMDEGLEIVEAEPAQAPEAVDELASTPEEMVEEAPAKQPNAVGFAKKSAQAAAPTETRAEPEPKPEILPQPGAIAVEEAGEESPAESSLPAPEPAAETPQESVEIPVAAPEQEPLLPETTAEATAPADGSTTEVETVAASGSRLSPYPKGEVLRRGGQSRPQFGEETRAPRLNRQPSAIPVQDFSGQSFSDALETGADFGPAESLFETPDWTKPLENLEADEMGGSFDSDLVEATGNVRLTLGDTRFQADSFSYRESTGEMHAKGNVIMEQPTSMLTADEVFYTLPADRELPPPPPLKVEDESSRNKRRLSLGQLEATNVHIQEPDREMRAALVEYDALTGTGMLTGVEGTNGQFYFGAAELTLSGPESMSAKDVWVTTCDTNPAPYRIVLSELEVVEGVPTSGKNARMQIRNFDTPLFLPVWRRSADPRYPFSMDFDSGRGADLGFFVNVGQRFQVSPDITAGPRIFATEDEGVGLGGDVAYDFMATPNSWLYRTEGEAHGLYTTEDRGYIHWYNRYEPSDDLVVRMQTEHWGDSDFYKDFYYEQFRDRTTPRSFANATYTQDDYIATGTVRMNTHGWVSETERYPEGTFHLLERELLPHTYVAFDSVSGINEREPAGPRAVRTINTARLTYDWDVTEAFNIAPYYELELSWYSRERDDGDASFRVGNTAGVTMQTRLHKTYDGAFGFSAFKHVVVPSITYSYRPSPSLDAEDTPLYDSLDSSFGRSRIETKLDNIVFGKDAVTGEVWQVGRLSLYQGNDFWNEFSATEDYEIEIDIRPRPWWGIQLVGERHVASDDIDLNSPFYLQRVNLAAWERITGRPYSIDANFAYNASYGDYDRMLAQVYYNDEMLGGNLQGRVGFAYTETQGSVFNRELLYGLGYQLSPQWGLAFEHRYDFEDNTLRSQSYEVRRRWDCWESALRVRDRESGTDIDLEFSISAFPATRVKF